MARRSAFAGVAAVLILTALSPGVVGASPGPPVFISSWGSLGSGDNQFDTPNGITVDASGDVYVADLNNQRIVKSAPDGSFMMLFGGSGPGEGGFLWNSAVAVDGAGNIYVTDGVHYRIQKFNPAGTFLQMWGWGVDDGTAAFQTCTSGCQAGLQGDGDGQLDRPNGIAIDPVSGDVFVSDTWNNRIQRFTSSGSFVGKWGSPGTAEGNFNMPESIAFDPSGNLHVVEHGNNRIQTFAASGTFLHAWGWGVDDGSAAFQTCTSGCQAGLQGDGNGQFAGPYGIAVDDDGHVWVADTGNNRMQMFDSSGSFLTGWGTPGSDNGEFNGPVAVAAPPGGAIYVVDQGNHRVQRFGPPTKLSMKAPAKVAAGTQARVKGKLSSPEQVCTSKQKVMLKSGKRTLATKKTASDGSYAFSVRVLRKMTVYVSYESLIACGPSRSAKSTIRV